MRSKYDKKNIKNQMQDMKLKKIRSNSIQLTNRGSFCNFAKPTHILR
jgi:UDP-N-acetylenolpyruvoylglucosamine reductase